MADPVYIVIGTTGAYSDRTEWYVACYSTKEQAEDHADRATEWAKKWKEEEKEIRKSPPPSKDYPYNSPEARAYYQRISQWRMEHPTSENPYDPNCSIDDETEYGVFETPFVRHVDEYLEHIQNQPKE